MNAANPTRALGFSLIEMMVVTAIASILISIATAALVASRRQAYVNGETRSLLGLLKASRTKSIALGRKHGLYLGGPTDAQYPSTVVAFAKVDPDATSNLLDTSAGDQILSTNPLGWLNGRPIVSFGGGIPGSGSVTITFDPNGAPFINIVNPTGSPPSGRDWALGPFAFQLLSVDDPLAPRRVITLRSDGNAKVTQ